MFEKNSLVMLAGPSYSFKSFLALDWMMCMAAGRKWNDRKVLESKVLYVLGEGKASLLKRIQAWLHYNQISQDQLNKINANFRVSFDVPQMALKSSVDNLLAGLIDEDFSPDTIVIDTLARSFVGMDENSQKDTGIWIESADRMRKIGYTVLFLHHTKKNTEFGVAYRGSTAIMGAMDTAMTLVRETDSNRTKLTVNKQKDHDEGNPMHFQRLVVKPDWQDPEGSCVLVPILGIDERFTAEYQNEEDLILGAIQANPGVGSTELGRILADKLGGSEEALRKKVERRLGKRV